MLSSSYNNIPFRTRDGSYRIRLATQTDYNAILQLQESALETLLPAQRQYVFRRQRAHIQNVLSFAGNILVAETADGIFATMLMNDVADMDGYLRALDMDAEGLVPMSFADGGIVMQSLLVHADYQGNGIAQLMFAAAVDVAKQSGVGFIAMAENRLNKPAIKAAFKNSFQISGFGTHSTFGVPGYIFCCQLADTTGVAAPATLKADNESDLMALVLSLIANNNQISAVSYEDGLVEYRQSSFAGPARIA